MMNSLPCPSICMHSVSESDRQQGVTHCDEILLNNIKTASSNQISSLQVVWQDGTSHHCLGAEEPSARCTSLMEVRGEHDRATSPPVEGKVYCLSDPCMQHLKLWLMQGKLYDWCVGSEWIQRCRCVWCDEFKTSQSGVVWHDETLTICKVWVVVWIALLNVSQSDDILGFKKSQYFKIMKKKDLKK